VIIGIPSEIKPGERRVAMSPSNVLALAKKEVDVFFSKRCR